MKRLCVIPVLSLLISTNVSATTPTLIAFDMVNSTSQNLLVRTNAFENAFSSAGDGFQVYRRGVTPSIPFSVLDDSLAIFPSDTQGIIDENFTDEFFGVTDTVNGDNSSDVVATWDFNVAGSSDLSVSIDVGAMGDFESSDTFVWTASIDGGAEEILFESSVDESGSNVYTLAGGATSTLNDPMLLDGTVLTNILQTFSAPLSQTGNVLTLTLTANTDGGSEAFAFTNLRVLSGDDVTVPPPSPEPTGPVARTIHEIQGNGSASPILGEEVQVEAIVVGDFQNNTSNDNGNLSGFYVQEEDTDADADPLTSEGIFVFDNDGAVDVNIGDRVLITGEVEEFFGQTQISLDSITILASNEALPTVTDVTLPVNSLDDFEAFEGMYVRFPQALVISEYFNYDRFGEMVLAYPIPGEGRPFTPTAIELPASQGFVERAATNSLSRITLDDGLTVQNPDANRHPNGAEFTLSNRFRGGDAVTNATGILNFAFGLYRLQPTQGADYTPTNPRPVSVPVVGGDIKVASFNVLNFFTTLDENGNLCGPSLIGCRGADNAEEFARQRDKIVSALVELDADVVGLIEVENDDNSVEFLAQSINDFLGDEVYLPVSTGSIGGDAIKVGYLYKAATIEASGDFAILDSTVDARFIDDQNRPVLAQTFMSIQDGSKFTIALNHLKSKGSPCDDIGDPDIGDGQGNCNLTRNSAAVAMLDWLDTDPTNSNDPDFLIMGDLNSYDREDPIVTLTDGEYVELVKFFQGELAYSFVFDGQYGYLDYALANPDLNPQITGTDVWAINADEPDVFDFDTSFKSANQISLFEVNPFRSSDHDPVIVGLDLNAPPSCEAATSSKEILQREDETVVSVLVNNVIDPEGDPVEISISSVSDADNSNSDIVIGDANDVLLGPQAASDFFLNQRSYTVDFTATSVGGSCEGSVEVAVPSRFARIKATLFERLDTNSESEREQTIRFINRLFDIFDN